MAKNIDYSKIKAMASSILECIGDDSEGENPSLPKQDSALDDGGQSPLDDMGEAADDSGFADSKDAGSAEDKKKKKDSQLAMMSSMLSKSMPS